MSFNTRSQRSGVWTVGGLLSVEIVVLAIFGLGHIGLILANAIELLIVVVVAFVLHQMARRCTGYARGVWHLMSLSYLLYGLGAGLFLYTLFKPDVVLPFGWMHFLFNMWFTPLGLAILIQPDSDGKWLNSTFAADLVQTLIYSVAAYFYLATLRAGAGMSGSMSASYFSYFFYCLSLILACFLRSRTSMASSRRLLFQQIGIWLSLTLMVGCVDWVGWNTHLGPIFQLRYSLVMALPLYIACRSQAAQLSAERWDFRIGRHSRITLLLPLLYPLLIVLLAISLSRQHLAAAWIIVAASFIVSSTRQLLIQDRLVITRKTLELQATHDYLTGSWNRGAILNILEVELGRAVRSRATVGLIMLDLDYFKLVNDSYGHAVGDLLLKALTSEIVESLRPYDSFGRYGGEEFLIVAPSCSLEDAVLLAERVRSKIAAVKVHLPTTAVGITASAGVVIGDRSDGVDALLLRADTACYQAKKMGRNRVIRASGFQANDRHRESASKIVATHTITLS